MFKIERDANEKKTKKNIWKKNPEKYISSSFRHMARENMGITLRMGGGSPKLDILFFFRFFKFGEGEERKNHVTRDWI